MSALKAKLAPKGASLLLALAIFLGCVGLFTQTANALPVYGVLNIKGDVTVNASTIKWLPASGGGTGGTAQLSCCAPPNTGFFANAPYEAPNTVNLLNLDNTPQPVGGSGFVFPNFLTFSADALTSFTLTYIAPGSFTSANCFTGASVGQTCTPVGSPFSLTNIDVGGGVIHSNVTFTAKGNIINGVNSTPFTAIFGTQLDTPYQDALNIIYGPSKGSVTSTFSATFTSVPEPASLGLIGGSLLALGLLRKKRA